MIQNQGLYFVSIFSSRLTLQLYKLDFTRLSLDQNFAIKHFIFMYLFLYMTCDWFDWRWVLSDRFLHFVWQLAGVHSASSQKLKSLSEEWGRCCLLPLPWSAGASKPATTLFTLCSYCHQCHPQLNETKRQTGQTSK